MSVAILYNILNWQNAKIVMLSGYLLTGLATVFILIHKLQEKKRLKSVEQETSYSSKKTKYNILDA